MISSLALRIWGGLRPSCVALIFSACSFRALPTHAQAHKLATNQPDQTAPFVGCYEFKLGRWWPWGYGGDSSFVTPPKRVQLLDEPGTEGFEQDGFLLRGIAEPGKPVGGRGRPSYWQVDSGKQVLLIWNDGFTGVTLKLEEDGSDLRGWAHPHFDSPHFIPHIAHVVATRIDCTSAISGPKAK
jgi:hypothetical protein